MEKNGGKNEKMDLIKNYTWITPIIERKIKRKPERGKPRRQSYIKQNMLDVGKGLYKEHKEVTTNKKNRWILHHLYSMDWKMKLKLVINYFKQQPQCLTSYTYQTQSIYFFPSYQTSSTFCHRADLNFCNRFVITFNYKFKIL